MIWYKNVVKIDIAIMNHTKRVLVFNDFSSQSFRAFGHHKALNSIVSFRISCPYHKVIRKGCITWPSLLSIDEPTSLYSRCFCLEACSVTSVVGFSQTKAAYLFHVDGFTKDSLTLLIISKKVNNTLTDSIMY